ncbi:tyrosine-type recombinase/integrase [Hyphomicrobium sp.]|uniref:tyrosine-type recombinase/integrase n=1 Tax=Hyphomicrobium sp. TaxID=82 RepID=UPI002E33370B|nr:tyrosine-type recombinase/integrase [Hyphomicrobium sp.]HEX2842053.1 tyrosine-type recombinase/integrase [Hyphomicrobium sp.]
MSSRSRAPVPHKRYGFWYLVRKVPTAFSQLDSRGIVRVSTGIRITDDPRGVAAKHAVVKLDVELHRYWRDLSSGVDPHLIKRGVAAVELAGRFGFSYLELSALNSSPIDELSKRLSALESLAGTKELPNAGSALFGLVPSPRSSCRLSELVDDYEKVQAVALKGKSADQWRRWRNQRDQMLERFLKLIGGDKLVEALTVDDVRGYRDALKGDVLKDRMDVNTANKNIGTVAAMFRAVVEEEKLKVTDPFVGMRLKGGEKKQRTPFVIEFVQNVLLKDGVMDGLNPEARAIFYVVAETGMRPSEVVGLQPEDIILDQEIPRVVLRDNKRKLKTKHSARTIPLAGMALEVMRRYPNGFPTYRGKPTNLSNTVTKYLRENKLLPFEGQSFYSLRHAFKDRLRECKTTEELTDVLMGHSPKGDQYGFGPGLNEAHNVMKAIAFKAPSASFAEGLGRAPQDHLSALAQQQPRSGGRWAGKLRLVPTIQRQSEDCVQDVQEE